MTIKFSQERRKLGLALWFLSAFGLSLWAWGPLQLHAQVGAANVIGCNKIASLTAGPTTITQLVPAITGQSVFICGFFITNTAAAGTFSFSTGTSSNCGTGTAIMIPPQNVTSSAPVVDHVASAQIQIPQSAAFCITPSVATIAGVVYYSQF